jgi:hypothetical protein
MCWYGSQEENAILGRVALMVSYVATQILLVLLFFAYRLDSGPYAGGGFLVFVVYFIIITALPWILNEDLFNRTVTPAPRELTGLQAAFIALVVGANAFMVVVAVADVSTHPLKPLL